MESERELTYSVAELRAHTLTGVVQREIERMILSGQLAPGSRLNEQTVAAKLSVSRGPVREACRALAELGLVYMVPNKGVYIKELSKEDAIEVYDLRAGLVALSSSLLAPTMTTALASQLDRYIVDMDDAADGNNFVRFSEANLEFHDFIVRATFNARLIKLYRGLVKEFQLFRANGLVERGSLIESNREHREIVNALKARDPQASYLASFGHVTQGKHRMLEALGRLSAEAPAGVVS